MRTRTGLLFAASVAAALGAARGDDYLVVDLLTGTATYEGLLATQADSNARYNDAAYKTDKIVLRKVPRTAESAALPNGPFAGEAAVPSPSVP